MIFQRHVPRDVVQAHSRNQGARLDNSLKDLPARSQHMEVPRPSERAQTFRRVQCEQRSTVVPGNRGSLFLSHNVSMIWVLLLSGSASIIHRESRQVLERPGPCRSYKNRRGEDDTLDLEGHGIPSRTGCAAWRSQGTNSSSQSDHFLR